MSISQIIILLEFCLKNTYFLFQVKSFRQANGATMSSPISPLTVNLFMEEFKVKVISSVPHLWLRYIMTYLSSNRQSIVISSSCISTFRTHRSLPPWKIPRKMIPHSSWIPLFPQHLTTKVYQKQTHMDQYLQGDSNHNLLAKYSIYNTLAHRARVVCTCQPALKQEEDHITQVLLRCSSPPPSALMSLQTRLNHRFSTNDAQLQTPDTTTTIRAKQAKTFF